MLPLDTLLTFAVASMLLALTPGPDNIFVLTQSAMHGKEAGIMITLGLCTGLIAHTLSVALGVAVLFQTSALAFGALKMVGAAYLLYLAGMAFRSKGTNLGHKKDNPSSLIKLYRRGIIMNITNPKVSIFFLAFLPQFTDHNQGSIAGQMILLGGIFILSALIVFGAIALLASQLGECLNHSKRTQWVINRLAGTIFIGLALKLATAQQ